jgi:UDP-glucose 4-epimerase
MKILITGVAGFLGSHIAEALLKEGHNVVGIDNLIGGEISNIPEGVEFYEFDLNNIVQDKRDIFSNVDIVIHCACTPHEGLSVFSPAFVTQNTFQITANVLSASARANVKKFVYMSSMARYGSQQTPFTEDMTPMPQDPYGIAKYASEMLVKNVSEVHGMDYAILVPHNIIGPRQKYDDPFRNVVSIMINRALQGKQPIIYGDGSQMRCFSFVNDLINPILTACLSDAANGQTINIGPDDEFITINDLAKRICDQVGLPCNPIYLPGRPQEVKLANCSADKAREILNYKETINLNQGLSEMIDWIKANGTKKFKYHLPVELVKENTPATWTEDLFNTL